MIYLCYLGIWSYISLSAHQFGRDDYHNRSYRIGLLIDVMQWRLTCLAVLQAVGFAWTVYYMGTELLELYRLTLKDERCECRGSCLSLTWHGSASWKHAREQEIKEDLKQVHKDWQDCKFAFA